MSTQLKFDGPRLDELLERVGRELGPDAVIVEANRTRRGGVGGFFAKEWFEVIVDGDAATGPASVPADEAVIDDRSTVRASDPVDALLALADQVDDGMDSSDAVSIDTFAGVLARAAATGAAPVAPAGSAASVASDVPAASVAATAAAPERPADQPSVVERRSVAPARPAPALVPAPTARRLRDLPLGDMLGHLDRLVPTVTLPIGTTPIVAVVGDLSVARGVASSLAARMGLGAADVLVATPDSRQDVPAWLRIDSPETARNRAARWRRGEQPVVLAVDLTPGRDGHAWAADVLAALDADQIRLVARAWQVTDELAPKAAVLGGIDGIELVELDAAAEPEAFLELDLPVVGIDGRPATSELWAALLMERRNDATA